MTKEDLTKDTNEETSNTLKILGRKDEDREEEKEIETTEEVETAEGEKDDDVVESKEEQAEADELNERERALLKEISRLKAKNREVVEVKTQLNEIEPTVEEKEDEKVDVTTAEAKLYTAWRNEALEELLEKHPQYKTDPKLWDRFTKEYSERVPELVWAKRNGISVSKSLFKERLSRVHKSLQDNTDKAKEDGKKELLKAQSQANVMGAGATKSSQPDSKKPTTKRHVLPRKNSGLESWLTKKN